VNRRPHRPTPGYLVWRLAMKWRATVDAAVAPLGLTHAQYVVLASLWGLSRAGEQPCQRALADHTGLDPIYVSKLARRLEAGGLLMRVPDPADSRALRLIITEEGRKVIDPAIEIVRDLQEQLTAPLGGTNSSRTTALMDDLESLIAAPAAVNGSEASDTTGSGT
jgi:DNA-binding MarR family transcriptional regulator